MEVILAKTAGFCFGVERAINLVYEQIEKRLDGKRIYTFGSIINNAEVVNDLKEKGINSIESEEQLKDIAGNVLIIRSHGVPKSVYEEAEKWNLDIIDATCPFVKKIHEIVEKESKDGKEIIIVGDRNHPEVKGIIGWTRGKVTVLADEKEAESFKTDDNSKICIVSQTTFNLLKFQYVVEIIRKKGYDTCVMKTICSATQARQEEAGLIAGRADKMIVIGDKHSSNTQKLYSICKELCKDTYYIETLKDLDIANLQDAENVGITAGASTPNNIIQEVFLNVRGKKL